MDKQLFFNEFKEYSSFPSTDYFKTHDFLFQLEKDFKTLGRTVQIVFNKFPLIVDDMCMAVYSRRPSRYWLLIHVDKVSVGPQKPFSSNTFLGGQLDNTVSIVIAKHLVREGLDFNILFTTREETCNSYNQIDYFFKRVYKKKPRFLKLIDLDVDVFMYLHTFGRGEITLRSKDYIDDFDQKLVKEMRNKATELKIPWIDRDSWVVVQAGLLKKYTSYQAAYLGIPIINYHSAEEKTFWTCVENAYMLLYNLFKSQKIRKFGIF